MLAFLLMLALTGVCAWLGREMRPKDVVASNVAYAFSALFLILLLVAIFGI